MSRLFLLVLCSTLLLLLSPLKTFAQDGAAYCGQLGAEDCQLLQTSVEAMSDITSAATEMQMALMLRDVPEVPFQELFIQYDQSSAFMMSEEVQALVKDLQSMSPAQLEQMGDNQLFAFNVLRTLIGGMTFGLDLRLQMSDEMAAFFSEELRAELGMDVPTDLSLRLMNVDGVLYIDTTSIAPLIPEVASFFQGWVGLEAAPLLEMAEAELGAAGGAAPTAMTRSGSASGGITFGMAGPVVTTVEAVDPSGEVLQFLEVERIESEEGDTGVATFLTTVNYDKFFQSPVFRNLVYMISADQGSSMSASELDEAVTLAQIMGPSLLQGLELYLVEDVGVDDGYLYYSELLLEWDLASLLTLAATGDPSMQLAEGAEPFFGIEIISATDQLNEEIEISAPEGAFVVPTSMLMQFAGQ